jgi:hypothetical protein
VSEPAEYDYDGEPENGLPPIALARKHLIESISEWGDGDVMEGFNTRDMCALLAAVDRVEALADAWAVEANNPDGHDLLVQTYRNHARALYAVISPGERT